MLTSGARPESSAERAGLRGGGDKSQLHRSNPKDEHHASPPPPLLSLPPSTLPPSAASSIHASAVPRYTDIYVSSTGVQEPLRFNWPPPQNAIVYM